MPFTVSHVAAVLPFSRLLNRRHLLSAMVIGSMAPDFGVFLPWQLERGQTHGLHPLLTFCLPLGLFAFWLFQYLIKPPLFELLPDGAYSRWQDHIQPAPITRIGQWCIAALGVIAGTLTHLAWDAFTHEGARGVHMFPSLDEQTIDVAGHAFYGFAALQLASSVVGLLVVFVYVYFAAHAGMRKDTLPIRALAPRTRLIWTLSAIASVIVLTYVLFVWSGNGVMRLHLTQIQVGEMAIAALRSVAIALVVTSILLQFVLPSKK